MLQLKQKPKDRMLHLRRAVLISITIYLATFVMSIAASFLVGVARADTLSPLLLYSGALAATLSTAVGTWWYFLARVLKPSALHGLQFGLVVIGVGFILDMVLALPTLFISGTFVDSLLEYYRQPIFFVTLLLILLTTALVGHLLKNRPRA